MAPRALRTSRRSARSCAAPEGTMAARPGAAPRGGPRARDTCAQLCTKLGAARRAHALVRVSARARAVRAAVSDHITYTFIQLSHYITHNRLMQKKPNCRPVQSTTLHPARQCSQPVSATSAFAVTRKTSTSIVVKLALSGTASLATLCPLRVRRYSGLLALTVACVISACTSSGRSRLR